MTTCSPNKRQKTWLTNGDLKAMTMLKSKNTKYRISSRQILKKRGHQSVVETAHHCKGEFTRAINASCLGPSLLSKGAF